MAKRTDAKLHYEITADGRKAANEVKKVDAMFRRIGGASAHMAGDLAARAVSRLTGVVADAASAVLNYSSSLEQSKIGFETLMGSASGAQKHLKDLQTFAKTTPFKFDELVLASQQLQGVGIEAERIVPILSDVGNALSAAGRMDSLPFALKALGDIQAKGKLAGQEILQLANAGIPIRAVLARELGVTTEEVMKMGEQGKISAEMVFKALHTMSQERFGDAMVKQSKTFAGAMTNISDITLQVADEAFQPLYEELGKAAQALTQNEDTVRRWGQTTRQATQDVIDGFRGMTLPAEQGGIAGVFQTINKGLDELDWYLRNVVPATNALSDFGKSMREAGQAARMLQNLQSGSVGYTLNPDFTLSRIPETAAAVRDVGGAVNAINSLSSKLNADAAKKEVDALNKIVGDLTTQVMFFGQETEVAATMQRMLGEGVVNFDSAVAKSALSLAAQLDRLQAAKKAADDYNTELKSTREELERIREKASIEIRMPNASELQRFDAWVGGITNKFGMLDSEIERTRRSLQSAVIVTAMHRLGEVMAQSVAALNQQAIGLRRSLDLIGGIASGNQVEEAARDLAEALKLLGGQIGPELFGQEVQGFIDTYNLLKESIEGLPGAEDALAQVRNKLREYLARFKFGPDQKYLELFGDRSELDATTDAFLELGQAVSKARLHQGLALLDQTLTDLGLHLGNDGLVRDFEDFQRFLSDPLITAAIEARAKALGMTADEIKRALEAAKFGGGGSGYADPVRPKGMLEIFGGSAMDRIDEATGKVRTMSDVIGQLGQTAADTFMAMGQGLGSMLESWVLLGGESEASMKKMVASVLAGVAAQAATLAVFHTAMGIAALTPWGALYGPAPYHFKAAAIWGTVAAGAAIGGRAAAGDSFKSGGAAGSGGGTSGRQQDPAAITRQSDDVFISGRRSESEALTRAVEKLEAKIDGVSPGDVLGRALSRSGNRRLVLEAVDERLSRAGMGHAFKKKMNRS